MSQYRLNAETFRVRQNDTKLDKELGLIAVNGKRIVGLEVERGLAVVKGQYLNGAARVEEVDFIDPAQDPGARNEHDPTSYEELKIALDPNSPPALRMRLIRELSIDASLRMGGTLLDVNPFNTPLWAYSPVDRPVARVALVSLIDRDPHSFNNGNAYILDKDEGVVIIQEMRAGTDAQNGAGVSFVMIPEGEEVKIQHSNDGDSTNYSLRYRPDKPQGIVPCAIVRRSDPETPPLPPPAEGSGDREPRKPIKPQSQGSISLELPIADAQ